MAQILQFVKVLDQQSGSTGNAIITGQISNTAAETTITLQPSLFTAAGLDDAAAVTEYIWVDGTSSVAAAPVTVALNKQTLQAAILTWDAAAAIVNFVIIGRRTS